VDQTATHILFLGAGSAGCAQMAAGWARHFGLAARSARPEECGDDPRAIAVMREAGVDISRQTSLQSNAEMLAWADLVVTVSDHVEDHSNTPPPGTQRLHWVLADPAQVQGTDEHILASFRAARDDLKLRVTKLAETLANARIDAEERTDDYQPWADGFRVGLLLLLIIGLPLFLSSLYFVLYAIFNS
jgi:arsenate reductase